jgi:hypothetical protein
MFIQVQIFVVYPGSSIMVYPAAAELTPLLDFAVLWPGFRDATVLNVRRELGPADTIMRNVVIRAPTAEEDAAIDAYNVY